MLSMQITTLGTFMTPRQQLSVMSFLSWLLLGLVAGFIGSKIVNRAGEGIVRDILLGVFWVHLSAVFYLTSLALLE